MKELIVDRERCTRCGLCIDVCNRKVLAADGEGLPAVNPERAGQCNECGHCGAVCPAHACTAPGPKDTVYPLAAANDVTFEQARQFILSCRSVRRYKEQPVAREEIVELLEVARRAPTGSNVQPIRWLSVGGRDKMRRISDLIIEWFDTEARANQEALKRYNIDEVVSRYKGGYDIIFRDAPNAVFAITGPDARWGQEDGAIALTYFCLAAHARNIGSCWCGFGMRAVNQYAPLREYLGLAQDAVVRAIAFFGHPDIAYYSTPPRKPLRVEWM